MAKLQRDDAKMLWEEMGENKEWSSLLRVLKKHVEKAGGIENETVLRLINEVTQFQDNKERFPTSSGKMADFLNQNDSLAGRKTGVAQARNTRSEHRSGQSKEQERGSNKATTPASEKHPQQRSADTSQPFPERRKGQPQAHEPPPGESPSMAAGTPRAEGVGKEPALQMYQPEHMEVIFLRGNWHNWNEVIDWLEQNGASDADLLGLDFEDLLRDLRYLRDQGVPIATNYSQAYRLADYHRRRR